MPFGRDVLLCQTFPSRWMVEYFAYIDMGCGYCQFDIIQNYFNIT